MRHSESSYPSTNPSGLVHAKNKSCQEGLIGEDKFPDSATMDMLENSRTTTEFEGKSKRQIFPLVDNRSCNLKDPRQDVLRSGGLEYTMITEVTGSLHSGKGI